MSEELTQAAEAHRRALLARQALDDAAATRNDAIRAAMGAGHSVQEIADSLGLHRQRVYQMLNSTLTHKEKP